MMNKIFSVIGAFVVKHLPVVILTTFIGGMIGFTILDYSRENIDAKNTAQKIMEGMDILDFNELIEKKGSDEEGYYWGFVDDIDEKLDVVIEKLAKDPDAVGINDKDLLKKMIQAEYITQLPDLGGKNFDTSVYGQTNEQKAQKMVEKMSTEQKVSQMLFVLISSNSELSQNAGGYVLEDGFDFSNAQSSIKDAQNDLPPIYAVDEEGGTVQRVFNNYPDARSYEDKSDEEVSNDYRAKARALLEIGINMNLAPVADLTSDSSAFMYKRSFSGDYDKASHLVQQSVTAMKEEGIITCLKHFPGYGNAEDTHNGAYTDTRDRQEIQSDINVFFNGINVGAPTVMTSHITVNSIDSENPASLSSKVVKEIRKTGFNGVVITDALNMGALADEENIYVRAVNAGNDVLEVTDFETAKKEIISAYEDNEISEDRINEAVTRILTLKLEYGVIEAEDIRVVNSDSLYESSDFVQNFLSAAQEITDYVRENNFEYGHAENMPPKEDGTTNPDGSKHISCDRLVAWALYKCGYTDQPQCGLTTSAGASPLMDYCKDKGWERIENVEDVQAGDIVFSGTTNSTKSVAAHTFICAGDDKRYDCGSKERIRLEGQYSTYTSQPFYESITNFICAYRVTTGLGDDDIDFSDFDLQVSNNFQGAIHLRRVMPDKEIGEMKNVSTGAVVESNTYVTAKKEGLGTKQDITEDLKDKMQDVSMKGLSGTTYDDLSLLIIPYYDFDGKVQKGDMIVNKKLADEVLLIFQELYNIKYPIERMYLVDDYDADDFKSIEANNTSAFNDRQVITADGTGEGISKHALGQAIDINPQINPYITNEGTSAHENAKKYNTGRDTMEGWSDTEKAAVIREDTEIYKIFTKYGWKWLGTSDNKGDTQHFEKTDLSSVTLINMVVNDSGKEVENSVQTSSNSTQNSNSTTSNNTTQNSNSTISNNTTQNTNSTTSKTINTNSQIAGDGKQYVVAIDAGHGPSEGAKAGMYATGTEDTSGLNTGMIEWESTKKVADAIRDKLSIYSNLKIVRIGNSDEHPMLKNGDRVNMAKEAGADMYVTIHYNSVESHSANGTETYYKPGDNTSKQFADILANAVSSSLGIKNRGSKIDTTAGKSLVIIKNSSEVGFPCVVVEGGFMSNVTDMQAMRGDSGIDKYAEGVAAGILEYCGLENKGYGQVGSGSSSASGGAEINAGIRSKIYDLKYVSTEKFNKDLEEKNADVLKEFTMDEENKISIATWSYDSDNGITYSKKDFQAGSTYTQKYTMPMEYLLAYYIDTENKEFVNNLANLAIDSEFVLAIQDNVSTTQTDVSAYKETKTTIMESTDDGYVVKSGPTVTKTDLPSETFSKISESVSTTVELTYGDTWFVRFYKDTTYSSIDLSSTVASTESQETGSEGKLLGTFNLEAYCKWCNDPKGNVKTESGAIATSNHTIAVSKQAYLGKEYDGYLKKGSKVIINGQVFTVEDVGNEELDKENWIGVFINGGATEPLTDSDDRCNSSDWNGEMKVYVAQDVTEASKNSYAATIAGKKRVNTVATIKGNASLVAGSPMVSTETSDPKWVSLDNGDMKKTEQTKYTTTTISTNSYKYNTGEMHVIGNEHKFVTICRNNRKFKERLKPEWLFKVLEKQADTVNMIDLTKYLLYRAMNQHHDFGVIEFNFDEYSPENFQTIKGIYGNTVEEKVWFAFRAAGYSEYATAGVMGNIYQESTFIPYNARWYDLDWSKQYMESVDNGTISREEFVSDGQGCGLVGWTWGKLKRCLL